MHHLFGTTEKTLTNKQDFLVIGVVPNRIDILKSIPGVSFRACWRNRRTLDIGGTKANFLSLNDLLAAKLAAALPRIWWTQPSSRGPLNTNARSHVAPRRDPIQEIASPTGHHSDGEERAGAMKATRAEAPGPSNDRIAINDNGPAHRLPRRNERAHGRMPDSHRPRRPARLYWKDDPIPADPGSGAQGFGPRSRAQGGPTDGLARRPDARPARGRHPYRRPPARPRRRRLGQDAGDHRDESPTCSEPASRPTRSSP